MEASVIIPVFNAAKTLDLQLTALARQEWSKPWEVIIADNGSTDESLAICRRYQDHIENLTIVDATARRGAGYARNIGAAHARGVALLFCDADDEVGTGYVRAMGEALSRHAVVKAVIDWDKLNPSWVRKSRISPAGSYEFFELKNRLFPVVGSGQLGIRHTLFDALGGFEDATIPHAFCEDDDLSVKLALFGEKPRLVEEAVFHYRLRNRLITIYKQARAYARGQVFLYRKYAAIGYPAPPDLSWRAVLAPLPHALSKAGLAQRAWICGTKAGWDSILGATETETIPSTALDVVANAIIYRKQQSRIE
jgi:glycosyltransferase involved in cell wall biosynthesis